MIAEVIVDISNSEVDKVFDYIIPSNFELQSGMRVTVPFGNRIIEGFCINIKSSSDGKFKLKEIVTLLDNEPLISIEMLELMRYMKERFYIRYVDSLRLILPGQLRNGKVKQLEREFIEINSDIQLEDIYAGISARAKSQKLIVERLTLGGEYLSVLNSEYSNQAVKVLIDKGYLVKSKKEVYRRPYNQLKNSDVNHDLTEMQQDAMDAIMCDGQAVKLLHGVTGSGKTEVYLKCIEEMLKKGKTAIMLVPEISLTPQMLRIFRGRFGDTVAMLHSGLSDGEKYDEWYRLYSGEAKIAIGARSAIFSPQKDIGIIIVDEEHDSSYISESNPRYITIDLAEFRAKFHRAKLVLGSATPSIESYRKAKVGEYQLIEMNTRISKRGMPTMTIVDMAKELREGNSDLFSKQLKKALIEVISSGNQAMIFLNRRGYSSFMMCKECGYIAKCADCDIALTYHSGENVLKCHYCGNKYKVLTHCPNCSSDKLKQGKIGTERVVEEVKKLSKDVKILRMDNDTTSNKTAYLDILGAFRAKEAQVLVGTQMIAKGHDFSDVTLVGVLDADMSLYFSDYRSTERTYQLITQVAGRAGRSEKSGEVIIQTFSPKHYLFNFIRNYDYIGFYDKEVNTREVTKFPPFTTVARVLISAEKEDDALESAKIVYSRIKQIKEYFTEDILYLQAMKSPVARIQNKFRYQILMRITRNREREIIKDVYSQVEQSQRRGVSMFVEINPQSMS